MRHDYKFHMNALGKLLSAGNIDGIKQYLNSLEAQVYETEAQFYCSNSIINALLSHYAERYSELDASFTVKLAMPETLSIPGYELCIVLGNLLENALEACAKKEDERCVELSVKTQGSQLAIMVRNSFNGEVDIKNKRPVSAKKGGGLGLQSVRALLDRYRGHILFEWDEDKFTVYVMLNLNKKGKA
jgi:sensor histidine kinase regulating citrate/malate metabolism